MLGLKTKKERNRKFCPLSSLNWVIIGFICKSHWTHWSVFLLFFRFFINTLWLFHCAGTIFVFPYHSFPNTESLLIILKKSVKSTQFIQFYIEKYQLTMFFLEESLFSQGFLNFFKRIIFRESRLCLEDFLLTPLSVLAISSKTTEVFLIEVLDCCICVALCCNTLEKECDLICQIFVQIFARVFNKKSWQKQIMSSCF